MISGNLPALTLHVLGFVLWIGSLLSLARLLVFRNAETDTAMRLKLGAFARKLGMFADIGATLAIIGGVWMLVTFPGYFKTGAWLHIKLTLVVVVLILHGWIRVKAKRSAQSANESFPSPILAILGLVVAAIIALTIFKPA